MRVGGRRGNAEEMLDEMALDGMIGEAIDRRELNSVGSRLKRESFKNTALFKYFRIFQMEIFEYIESYFSHCIFPSAHEVFLFFTFQFSLRGIKLSLFNVITRESCTGLTKSNHCFAAECLASGLAAATEILSYPSYFTDAAGSEVKFDEHGDGLARYEILNFRKGTNNNGVNGYHYRVRLISSSLIIVTRHYIIADA